MASAFADLTPADRYVVGRLAARDHVPAESLVAVPSGELDARIPGARAAYERRASIAAALQRRLGIDPHSPEYRTAAAEARTVLQQVDRLGSDHAA
jgi:hypothetical protein